MSRLMLEVSQGAVLSAEEMTTERDARLLVAGAWPDKELTVPENDLDGLVTRFSASAVPVKIEHADSPLDPVGLVKRLWREGDALMRRLAFPPDLAGFLARRGIAKLSVGLDRDPLALAEVSLVLRPRVAAATLLSEEASGGDSPEVCELRAALAAERLEGRVAALKAAGRLAPAAEPLARALLSVGDTSRVTLRDGTDAPIGDVFRRFLEAQPPVIRFGETARGGVRGAGEEGEHPFTSDEAELLRRLGVSPGDVAKTLAAERKTMP